MGAADSPNGLRPTKLIRAGQLDVFLAALGRDYFQYMHELGFGGSAGQLGRLVE